MSKQRKGDAKRVDRKEKFSRPKELSEEQEEDMTFDPHTTFIVCGNNQRGELTTGIPSGGIYEPKVVDLRRHKVFRNSSVDQVFCSEGCTFIVSSESDVFTCGRTWRNMNCSADLVCVEPFVGGYMSSDPITLITFEPALTAEFYLTRSGTLYCRAYGDYIFPKPFKTHVPQLISPAVFGNSPIKLMDTDYGFKIFVTDKDDIYVGGKSIEKIRPVENEFLHGDRIKSVECGNNFGVILTVSGAVFSCGANSYGQLGGNYTEAGFAPITGFGDRKIVEVKCGAFHAFYLTDQGNVWACGFNSEGQLGIGNTKNMSIPVMINTLPINAVARISCTTFHAFFFTADGDIHSCGLGHRGQLALGSTKRHNASCKKVTIVPKIVRKHFGDSVLRKMLDVATGVDHTIFYLTDRLHDYVDMFSVRLLESWKMHQLSDIDLLLS